MLTLYFAPGTSSMAPHIALHEIGEPFEARPLSFATNEQRDAPYRAINPEGKVPALLIDGRPLTEVARAHRATPAQIALAWLLARSSVMLPIPGTSKVEHLEENVAAATIQLADEEIELLSRAVG